MQKFSKKAIVAVISITLIFMISSAFVENDVHAQEVELKDEYRFVMIPILTQEWFDVVYDASKEAAEKLSSILDTEIKIDYQPPESADLSVQNQYLQRAISTNPDGIAVDLIDAEASKPFLKQAQNRGIPLMLYVSEPPEGTNIPWISNDFYEQGKIEGKALLERIDYQGKVALIHGVPTNTAHKQRYEALKDLFSQYEDVEIVAEAFSRDDVEKAHTEASRILSAHPDLDAFAVVDAAGPIGAGLALQEAGKVGEVKYVGIDDMPQLRNLMKEGVLDLSISTKPTQIGHWITISLLMRNLGFDIPQWLDTGIGRLTKEKVEEGFGMF